MEAFNEYIILNKSKHRERDNHLKMQNEGGIVKG